MVNFSNVEIIRAIMHKVSASVGGNRSVVTPSDRLLLLDDEAKTIIKERLVTAFGRQSKSFELDIQNDGRGSCFSYINSMRNASDEQFLGFSIAIANLLAESQQQSRIPGGYLLIVLCLFEQRPVYVIIKAEPHNALGVSEMNVQSVKNIILSPEQKLYKIVFFEQKELADHEANLNKDDYRVVLFDSIVTSNNSIAQYFYKDFLGLSIQKNAELQTGLFFTKMTERIWNKLDELAAVNAVDLLRAEILNEAHFTVNPHEIITNIIPLDKRDDFSPIIDQFPRSFTKNVSLINSKLGKKSIILSDNVRITAPTSFFNENVQVEKHDDGYVVKIRY